MWKNSNSALALCVSALLVASGASAGEALTLGEATSKTLQNNAALQVFSLREEVLQGRRQMSALRPAFELGAELENFAGTGSPNGLDEAELTVSLSSVIELGSKRQARLASIDAEAEVVRLERRAATLDTLGAMTTRFITVLALQERVRLARDAEELARQTISTVRERVDAGAAPDAELFRAQAVQSQVRLRLSQIEGSLEAAKVSLASYWGDRTLPASSVVGDLFLFGSSVGFEALYQRSVESPGAQVYASRERLQEAAVRLASSRDKSNLRWSFGVRRLEGLADTAVVASIEMPLFGGRRNRGDVAAASAERNLVSINREQAMRELYASLFEAYRTRALSIDAVGTLQQTTIPALEKALSSTRRAYESGRYGHLDLIAAQQALIDERGKLIDAATTALEAGVLIEQLSGVSLMGGEEARALGRDS